MFLYSLLKCDSNAIFTPPPHRDKNRVEKGYVCQIKQEILQSKVSQTHIEDSIQLTGVIASKDSVFLSSFSWLNACSNFRCLRKSIALIIRTHRIKPKR